MNDNTNVDGKKCRICGEFKILSEFTKSKRFKDGHRNECKPCTNQIQNERYLKKRTPIEKTDEGKACRTCGVFKPYSDYYKDANGYKSYCKECKSKIAKKYRDEHAEEISEKKAQYRKENAEYLKEYFRRHAKENAERIKKYKKQWNEENMEKYLYYFRDRYESNKDEILKQQRQYYQLNKEKVLEQNKRWKMKNIEKYKAYHKEYFKTYFNTPEGRENYYKHLVKRRSKKHKVDFTPFQRNKLLERDNWTCQSCGCKVHDRHKGSWNTPDKAHIDHIVPISKGGNSEPSNLQVLCRTCNLSKGDNVEEQMEMNLNTI